MVNTMRVAYSIACAFLLLSTAAFAEGMDSRGISVFAKGGSISPFTPGIATAPQQEIGYFPAHNTKLDIFAEEELKALEAAAPQDKTQETKKDAELAKLAPKDRLLSKYGDPSKDVPVLAVENAPAPFKAMMESLQEGQDDLAFQFAKQYVRHLKNVQDKNTRVLSLVGFAQKREGMIEDSSWSNAPALEEDKALFQKDILDSKAKAAKKGTMDESQLNAEAQKLVFMQKQQIANANSGTVARVNTNVAPNTLFAGGPQ